MTIKNISDDIMNKLNKSNCNYKEIKLTDNLKSAYFAIII
jgi:hypothetical protein